MCWIQTQFSCHKITKIFLKFPKIPALFILIFLYHLGFTKDCDICYCAPPVRRSFFIPSVPRFVYNSSPGPISHPNIYRRNRMRQPFPRSGNKMVPDWQITKKRLMVLRWFSDGSWWFKPGAAEKPGAAIPNFGKAARKPPIPYQIKHQITSKYLPKK